MTRWRTVLLCIFITGCSSASSNIRYTPAPQEHCVHLPLHHVAKKGHNKPASSALPGVEIVHAASPTGALPATPRPSPSPAPLRLLPGKALGDGIPRGVLRFAPAGSAAAALETAPVAGEFVFLGGAFIAAAGSTVLVCVTANAAANGQETPIDIADQYYDTHFSDIVGWVQGEYPSVSRARRRPANSKTQLETSAAPLAPPSAAPREEPQQNRTKNLGRVYVTYTKFNERTKRYYSGRTSMIIDLAKNHLVQAALAVALRDKNHHVDENVEPMDKEFLDAEIDEHDVGAAVEYQRRYSDIAYRRIRGREQQLIDYHGGAWSDTGEPHRTENRVRGVSRDNLKGRQFHEAAAACWGELHPYTGL